MLKMRLQRIGRKNNPSYRVLVVDSRQGPKSGKFVDILGSYDPENDRVALDGERARTWMAKGVQVSGTVHNLLVTQKIIEGKKINVLPRKSPIRKEADATAAAAPVAAEAPVSEELTAEPEQAPETRAEETAAEEPIPETAPKEAPAEPVAAE